MLANDYDITYKAKVVPSQQVQHLHQHQQDCNSNRGGDGSFQ